MEVTLVDIIVAVLILIFALIGLKKGFARMIFSAVKKAASFSVAYFLTKPLGSMLSGTVLFESFKDSIQKHLDGDIFSASVTEAGITPEINQTLKFPDFLVKLLNKVLDRSSEMTLGEAIAVKAAEYLLYALTFIVLLIVASVLIGLLGRLFNRLFNTGSLKIINRLLGFLIGILLGFFVVSILMWFVSLLCPLVPAINKAMIKIIAPEKETFGLARWLYNKNFVGIFIGRLLSGTTS